MELELEWLEEVLKEKEAVAEMVKLSEMRSEPAVAEGENFVGCVNRVHLKAQLSNGEDTNTSLILKRKPVEEFRKNEFLESYFFFDTEIKIYSEVLPALEEVLKEQGVPLLWPEFLGAKDNFIIFSDLKSTNYRPQCRKTRLDVPHILLVVRSLANFHAGSIVLRQRGLWDPSTLHPFFFARRTDMVKRLMSGAAKMFARVVSEDWGPQWSEMANKIQKKAEIYFDELADIADLDENRLNVLCHGDLWTANMLFKYSKDAETPIGVKFIDFQMAHYNSYACDLQYFIATSMPSDLRKSCYSRVLETYTEALRDSLTFHGYPEMAPTLVEVKAEMSRTELMRFFFTVGCMAIVTAECANALNLEALYDQDGIAQNPDIYRRKTYKADVEEEILAWEKAGLL